MRIVAHIRSRCPLSYMEFDVNTWQAAKHAMKPLIYNQHVPHRTEVQNTKFPHLTVANCSFIVA